MFVAAEAELTRPQKAELGGVEGVYLSRLAEEFLVAAQGQQQPGHP